MMESKAQRGYARHLQVLCLKLCAVPYQPPLFECLRLFFIGRRTLHMLQLAITHDTLLYNIWLPF